MIREPHHLAWLEVNPHRSAEWLKERLRDGFHVHHIDCDHENNDPDNLLLLDGVDHMRLHALPTARELKKLARARLVYAGSDPRETVGWRLGAVAYVLRKNAWTGYAAGKLISECHEDKYRPAEGTLVQAAKKFAKLENLEWPIKTPTCGICSNVLGGRRRYSHHASDSGPLRFPNGAPLHLSMLSPICDLLAEFGMRPENCSRGLPGKGEPFVRHRLPSA